MISQQQWLVSVGGKQYCNLRSHTAHATHRQLMSGGITGQQKLHLNDNVPSLMGGVYGA